MTPSLTAMSPTKGGPPVPSKIVPLRMTRSASWVIDGAFSSLGCLGRSGALVGTSGRPSVDRQEHAREVTPVRPCEEQRRARDVPGIAIDGDGRLERKVDLLRVDAGLPDRFGSHGSVD